MQATTQNRKTGKSAPAKKKDAALSLRLTTEDKERISLAAEAANMTISNYVIHLASGEQPPSQVGATEIAKRLCIFNNLIALVDDKDTRRKFYSWEAELWQYLK